MTLCIDGHEFQYEMENLCRVFFPDQKIISAVKPGDGTDVYTGAEPCAEGLRIRVRTKLNGSEREAEELLSAKEASDPREVERCLGVLLYRLLSSACGFRPRWGILTGVRPVKLFARLAESVGEENAVGYFEKNCWFRPKKRNCAV
ncbi:hypothetical protein [Caproicibacter fermentans]|uniref:hypothetical protein n=1 Tax=Caproicibacter fermentans TaxID=2576756 RepID=UPI001E54AA16|nr:hypothetical protein [Caproicibacter fermentans]